MQSIFRSLGVCRPCGGCAQVNPASYCGDGTIFQDGKCRVDQTRVEQHCQSEITSWVRDNQIDQQLQTFSATVFRCQAANDELQNEIVTARRISNEISEELYQCQNQAAVAFSTNVDAVFSSNQSAAANQSAELSQEAVNDFVYTFTTMALEKSNDVTLFPCFYHGAKNVLNDRNTLQEKLDLINDLNNKRDGSLIMFTHDNSVYNNCKL